MFNKQTRRRSESPYSVLERLTWPALSVAPCDYLEGLHAALKAIGIVEAVTDRNIPLLFNWLIAMTQFQGISDANAIAYADKHGTVHWDEIAGALATNPTCPRLRSYWHFQNCGYRKAQGTCAELGQLDSCPLPTHPARKGSLIIAAYALFLFVRDICKGDLISWIDQRLSEADAGLDAPDRDLRMRAAVLEPLRQIYGIGEKVWSMALADLLLTADPSRERWVTTGASMVAVDTLVHAFFHRTGSLRRFSAEHAYGQGCYAEGRCADIIRGLANRIDARRFDPSGPANFPRFIQFAIWRFCAAGELNICNGNRIDDRDRCTNLLCPAFSECDRIALRPNQP